ncbi:antA/AntB antirepressor family protein [Enterococcus faecium]|uniref:antA/AntB antirepressor family protein n=1 Tax=Enterococcus faecium TaxID=1352 RepID=UPI0022392124|nr:antA/AntB antirepressor family protein [Enterococcus faecium]
MKELIKVTTNENNEQLVSGRELHEFLEVATEYKKWFSRMAEYGFVENIDFVRVTQKCPTPGGIQNITDHAMKLDMVKEISMIQRTEKGKQARRYFIQVEKEYKQQSVLIPRTPRGLAKLALEANEETNQRLDVIEEQVSDLKENQPLPQGEYSIISNRINKRVYEVAEAYSINSKDRKNYRITIQRYKRRSKEYRRSGCSYSVENQALRYSNGLY